MLDLTKPLSTRDGRPVTLITTQGREPWPLVGYVMDEVSVTIWMNNGRFDVIKSGRDLINIPEPKRSGEVWVSVYDSPDGGVAFAYYHKKEDSDKDAAASNPRPIARFSYKWTEGEGSD